MKKSLKYISFALILNMFIVNVNAQTEFHLCETSALNTFRLVGIVLYIAKILVPIIIIGLGAIDLGKTVISADEKDMQTSLKNLTKRLIAGVTIFFIPTIIYFIMSLVDGVTLSGNYGSGENAGVSSDYMKCSECLLSPYSDECDTYMNQIDDDYETGIDKSEKENTSGSGGGF